MDGHCDTLCDGADGVRNRNGMSQSGHLYLERMKRGGVGGQIFAIYADDSYMPNRASDRTFKLISAFLRSLDENDSMVHVRPVSYTHLTAPCIKVRWNRRIRK